VLAPKALHTTSHHFNAVMKTTCSNPPFRFSPSACGLALLTLSLALLSPALKAQSAAPAPVAAPAPAAADDKIPEWVKKQADNPIKWIIQQDGKPKTKPATAEEKPVKRAATAPKKAKSEEENTVAAPVANTRTVPAAAVAKPSPAPLVNEPVLAAPAPVKTPEQPVANKAAEPPAAVATLAPAPEAAPLLSAKAALDALVPISQAQPVLSRDILQAGIRQGRVMVKFMVNADGSVTDVAVAETSDKLLNKSVIAAVKQWIYKPITQAQANTAEIAFKLE
jgi:TonB family protein